MRAWSWNGLVAAILAIAFQACGGQEASSATRAVGDGDVISGDATLDRPDTMGGNEDTRPRVDGDVDASFDAHPDAAPPDSGISCADAGYDGPAWGPGDFASYRWIAGGTGMDDRFFMNRDCGIDSQTSPVGVLEDRSGVVAPADCDDFKALVVSSAVLGALSSRCVCSPMVTDDIETTEVALVSGAVYKRDTTGCASAAPFAGVESKLRELEWKYLSSDAGTDSDAPAD